MIPRKQEKGTQMDDSSKAVLVALRLLLIFLKGVAGITIFVSMTSEVASDENRNVVALVGCVAEGDVRVDLSRPVYTNHAIKNESPLITVQAIKRQCREVVNGCWRTETILSLLPVITWIRLYKWKRDVLPDILAGLTVGIMSIPQGMAYARLAGIPPVYGLYTNIVPTIVYFFLGTAKTAAIGPITVLSLIIGGIRYKHIPCQDCWMYSENSSALSMENSTNVTNDPDGILTPIDVGSALAFLAGVFLILMGLFRLSFISNYLPDQLVGGFTIAAAVQVFAGQLSSIFGIALPNRQGVGQVVRNVIDLFSLIVHTNVATLIIFVVSFVFLLISKHLITPRFQPKLKLPFPGEFFVMVAATMASHFGGFGSKYDVSTVRHIAAGLPGARLPKLSLMRSLAPDAFLLAIITYSHSISLAKLYAKRNGYRVKAVQEFYAYGFMNLIGSFFQCFNSAQSVSRSLVYEAAGAKSQLCGLFGTVTVVITVLFIAPFLESLPNAALAAIIVAACTEMFRSLKELPALCRTSMHDAAIYSVTLASVVLLDVTYGLAVSVAFALITVILRSQRSRIDSFDGEAHLLYSSDSLGDVEIADRSTLKGNWDKIMFLRLTTPWFYANAEKLKNALLDRITVSAARHLITNELPAKMHGSRSPAMNHIAPVQPAHQEKIAPSKLAVVILDFTAVTFTDIMGINAMKEVATRMKHEGIALYICGCTNAVETLMSSSHFSKDSDVLLFPTVLDAVSYARFKLQRKGVEETVFVKQFGDN